MALLGKVRFVTVTGSRLKRHSRPCLEGQQAEGRGEGKAEASALIGGFLRKARQGKMNNLGLVASGCCLDGKCPQGFMCLKAWSSAGGPAREGCRTFGRWSSLEEVGHGDQL